MRNVSANKIKMMVNLYPSSSIDFCHHHGKDGARRYLQLAAEGINIEKMLSKQVTNEEIFRSYGSLYVAEYSDIPLLRQEYELLVELNCPGIEWWDETQVHQYAGGESARFGAGIYFPNDGVINSGQVISLFLIFSLLIYFYLIVPFFVVGFSDKQIKYSIVKIFFPISIKTFQIL